MMHNLPSFQAHAFVLSWIAFRDQYVTEQKYVLEVDNHRFTVTIQEDVLGIEPEPFAGEGIA